VISETPLRSFLLGQFAKPASPFIEEDGLDCWRLSQGTEKSGWFFYSCEVLF